MKPTVGLSLTVKVAALLLISAGSLVAQIEVGRVTGTVTDRSGAVISNAKVTLTNIDTGVSAVTATTPSGLYAFPACRRRHSNDNHWKTDSGRWRKRRSN